MILETGTVESHGLDILGQGALGNALANHTGGADIREAAKLIQGGGGGQNLAGVNNLSIDVTGGAENNETNCPKFRHFATCLKSATLT